MDDRIRAVLEDPDLMARIARAVRGAEPREEQAPTPVEAAPLYSPAGAFTEARGPSPLGNDKGLALLAALAPFLKESRRKKLDMARGVLSAAAIYKNAKSI